MLIKVKVFPGSKKAEIVKKSEDSFEVRVKEKAERGLANQAAMAALVLYMGVRSSEIKLIKGAKQRNKIFKIADGVF